LGIVAIELAELKPPNWNLAPMEAVALIPKQPPPTLKSPSHWSSDFVDFVGRCLKKDPKERTPAKDLLNHPFILAGSSSQILPPLLRRNLANLQYRKQKALQRLEREHPFGNGTLVSVDNATFEACITSSSAIEKLAVDYKDQHSKPFSFTSSASAFLDFLAHPSRENRNLFGVPLEETLSLEKPDEHLVLLVIRHLCETALDTEGVFTDKAKPVEIEELRNHLEKVFSRQKQHARKRADSVLKIKLETYPVHVLVGVLKLYILELPEPLLTRNLYKKFLETAKIQSQAEWLTAIKILFPSLPKVNKIFLSRFFNFLGMICSYTVLNGMTPLKLAKYCVPLFIYKEEFPVKSSNSGEIKKAKSNENNNPKSDVNETILPPDLIEEYTILTKLLNKMIENCKCLFSE